MNKEKRRLLRPRIFVLFMVCALAWIWSYPFRERIAYADDSSRQLWIFELGGGEMFFGNWGYADAPGWELKHLGRDPSAGELEGTGFSLLGFQFFLSPNDDLGSFVIIPLWFLTILSAIPFLLVWRNYHIKKDAPGGWA